MTTSAILQVLLFATKLCGPATHEPFKTWNQKRIHASVTTCDRFRMFHIQLVTADYVVSMISMQDI
jgi:hypothetical protein